MDNSTLFKGSLCIENIPSSCGLIIFGASGDLTSRKLIPALFSLYQKKLLPKKFFILGCSRTAMKDIEFRDEIKSALSVNAGNFSETIDIFLKLCFYVNGNYSDKDFYSSIKNRLEILEKDFNTNNSRVFYMSTPPTLYQDITINLYEQGLTKENAEQKSWVNLVFEKPFCWDLDSAIKFDKELHKYVLERQIYRIDHYLGKDTVQNILLFRFANAIFEPIWNRRYIDHFQITVAESIGVGHRAGYFEQSGLLRDMFQNHMLQMLALVTMECPSTFEADRVRDEKVKLLRSIRFYDKQRLDKDVIRAQYIESEVDEEIFKAYREELNVDKNSLTETYVALKLLIDNWRWAGVPFYLRAGKRLAKKTSQIAVVFKSVPHSIFPVLEADDLAANVFIFSIQPDEGIELTIQAKKPGPKLCMSPLQMKFKYEEVFGTTPPDAYERLLLDCMLGDQTLSIRSDAMELSWNLLTPILECWSNKNSCKHDLNFYKAGSWGPLEADKLINKDNRSWINF